MGCNAAACCRWRGCWARSRRRAVGCGWRGASGARDSLRLLSHRCRVSAKARLLHRSAARVRVCAEAATPGKGILCCSAGVNRRGRRQQSWCHAIPCPHGIEGPAEPRSVCTAAASGMHACLTVHVSADTARSAQWQIRQQSGAPGTYQPRCRSLSSCCCVAAGGPTYRTFSMWVNEPAAAAVSMLSAISSVIEGTKYGLGPDGSIGAVRCDTFHSASVMSRSGLSERLWSGPAPCLTSHVTSHPGSSSAHTELACALVQMSSMLAANAVSCRHNTDAPREFVLSATLCLGWPGHVTCHRLRSAGAACQA